MSKKATPGDGQHGKGNKGLPEGAPHQGALVFLREFVRGMLRLMHR